MSAARKSSSGVSMACRPATSVCSRSSIGAGFTGVVFDGSGFFICGTILGAVSLLSASVGIRPASCKRLRTATGRPMSSLSLSLFLSSLNLLLCGTLLQLSNSAGFGAI